MLVFLLFLFFVSMLLSGIGQDEKKGNDRVLCCLTDSILLIKDLHCAWLSKHQSKTNQTNTFMTLHFKGKQDFEGKVLISYVILYCPPIILNLKVDNSDIQWDHFLFLFFRSVDCWGYLSRVNSLSCSSVCIVRSLSCSLWDYLSFVVCYSAGSI